MGRRTGFTFDKPPPKKFTKTLPGVFASERDLTNTVVDYLSLALRPPAWFTLFPAGGPNNSWQGKLGLKRGVPDLLVLWPATPSGCHLLGLELKANRGRMTVPQIVCHHDLEQAGARVRLCRSLEDVAVALEEAGAPTTDIRIEGITP